VIIVLTVSSVTYSALVYASQSVAKGHLPTQGCGCEGLHRLNQHQSKRRARIGPSNSISGQPLPANFRNFETNSGHLRLIRTQFVLAGGPCSSLLKVSGCSSSRQVCITSSEYLHCSPLLLCPVWLALDSTFWEQLCEHISTHILSTDLTFSLFA
jgi:hypothetical protein